jgi:hypothetical protein
VRNFVQINMMIKRKNNTRISSVGTEVGAFTLLWGCTLSLVAGLEYFNDPES